MVAAAFWAFKINRTRDTWVGTELNRRLGRETLPRIPSNEKRRGQWASLSSGAAAAARLQEDGTGTVRVTASALHSVWLSGRRWIYTTASGRSNALGSTLDAAAGLLAATFGCAVIQAYCNSL